MRYLSHTDHFGSNVPFCATHQHDSSCGQWTSSQSRHIASFYVFHSPSCILRTFLNIEVLGRGRILAKMPTVQISDDLHPKEELRRAQAEAKTSGTDSTVDGGRFVRRSSGLEDQDGIYNIRSRSGAPQLEARKRTTSQLQDEDPGLHNEADYKQKQVRSSFSLTRTLINTIVRSLVGRCYYGFHINQSASYTVTLVRVHCMCTQERSRRHRHERT